MTKRQVKAGDAAVSVVLSRLESMTGKAGEEMLGVILAWKNSHERVQELERADLARELEAIIARAKSEGKLTPHEERTFRELVASGDATVAGIGNILATKAAHRVLVAAGHGVTAANGSTRVAMTHNGKTWDQLKPAERAALKRQDRGHYDAIQAEYRRHHQELDS